MPEPTPEPDGSSAARPLDLPLIREFDDRSSLWLLEDPWLLRGLLQLLNLAPVQEQLPGSERLMVFAIAMRIRGNVGIKQPDFAAAKSATPDSVLGVVPPEGVSSGNVAPLIDDLPHHNA